MLHGLLSLGRSKAVRHDLKDFLQSRHTFYAVERSVARPNVLQYHDHHSSEIIT